METSNIKGEQIVGKIIRDEEGREGMVVVSQPYEDGTLKIKCVDLHLHDEDDGPYPLWSPKGTVTVLAEEVEEVEEGYPLLLEAVRQGHAYIYPDGDISVGTVFCGMSHIPADEAGTFDQSFIKHAEMYFCMMNMQPYGLCHMEEAEKHIMRFGSIPLSKKGNI